jgi:peroxiredoxin
MQLRPFYPQIKAAGSEVLLISFYPADRTKNWANKFELPFRLASDVSRESYFEWGLGDTKPENNPGFSAVVEGLTSFVKLRKVPEHLQHVLQLGGYFVLDDTGKVLYSYAPKSAVDNPPLDELLAALEVKSSK